MMRSKVLPSLMLTLAFGASASVARASVVFPEALRKQLGLTQVAGPPPGCQLCHKDDAGGLETATRPFGRSLLQAGTAGGSVPSLLAALAALERDGTDSDRDGVSDIAELKAGDDPNVPAVVTGGEGGQPASPAAPPDVPLPETGCALVGAPAPLGAWLTLAGFAGLALRLRRARTRR